MVTDKFYSEADYKALIGAIGLEDVADRLHRSSVTHELKTEGQSSAILSERLTAHRIDKEEAQHVVEWLEEPTKDTELPVAHVRLSMTLSRSESEAEQDESAEVMSKFWKWVEKQGGLEVSVYGFLRYPAATHDCVVRLPLEDVEIGGVFTAAPGVLLVKRRDDAESGPSIYEVNARLEDGEFLLGINFLSRLAGAQDTVVKLLAHAKEIGSFAMRARADLISR